MAHVLQFPKATGYEVKDMSKETIVVHGEKRVVREDTAKAFRGIHWALWSLAAFIIIMLGILFSGAFQTWLKGGSLDHTPATIENKAR